MNSVTLNFKNDQFETFYRKQSHKTEFQTFKKSFFIICTIGALSTINNFYQQNYLQGGFLLCLTSLLIFCYVYARTSYNVMDFSVCITSTAVNAYITYFMITTGTASTDPHYLKQYYMGIFQAYLQIGLFIGTRFYLKALNVIITTSTILIFLYIDDSRYLEVPRLLFLMTAMLCYLYIYLNEKQKRLLFMVENQNKQWEQGLDSTMNISILQCTYNEIQRQITLNKYNSISQQEFELSDQVNYKGLLRGTLLKRKIQKKSKMINLREADEDYQFFMNKKFRKKHQGCMTLEKILYLMFVNPVMFKLKLNLDDECSIYNQQFSFTGYFQKQFFKIQLFAYYDQVPKVTIMIQKQADLEEKLNYYYKAQNYEQIKRKMLSQTNDIQKIIVYIKQMLNYNQIKQYLIPRQVLTQLYLHYNKLINLQNYCGYQHFKNQYSKFNLKQIITDIRYVLKPVLYSKRIDLVIVNNSFQQTIISHYWMLYQILLNLLLNSIQYSPQKKKIYLIIETIMDPVAKMTYTKFTIQDKGNKFLQKELDKLPILNPIELDELIRSSSYKKLRLGLIVANKLISLLGKSSRINVDNYAKKKQIKFKIVNDLSQQPMNKFQKSQKFQINMMEKEI